MAEYLVKERLISLIGDLRMAKAKLSGLMLSSVEDQLDKTLRVAEEQLDKFRYS